MPPVTNGFDMSGGVQWLHCTGFWGDSMALGLAVKELGAIPFARIATGATPPVCTVAKLTSGPGREKAFYLLGKGWCCV